MARKTMLVRIPDEPLYDRDKGKCFLLTEMAASKGEKWAARAFLALARSGIDVPPNLAQAGMAGIAALTLRAISGVYFAEAEPLLDEMMACIQVVPNPERLDVIRPVLEDDIEEVMTRIHLRQKVFELHTGFLLADEMSKLT